MGVILGHDRRILRPCYRGQIDKLLDELRHEDEDE